MNKNYRQWFRQARKKQGELSGEFAMRLSDFMDKWMQRCDDVEAVKDKLVMEQFSTLPREQFNTLPSHVLIWV